MTRICCLDNKLAPKTKGKDVVFVRGGAKGEKRFFANGQHEGDRRWTVTK